LQIAIKSQETSKSDISSSKLIYSNIRFLEIEVTTQGKPCHAGGLEGCKNLMLEYIGFTSLEVATGCKRNQE
jgi:hypothetical protein